MPKLAIIGYGKMGRLIDQLAPEFGFEVIARVDVDRPESPAGADVAVEFSVASAVAGNVALVSGLRIPIVIGTTGWQDHLDQVKSLIAQNDSAAVWSPTNGISLCGKFLRRSKHLLRNRAQRGSLPAPWLLRPDFRTSSCAQERCALRYANQADGSNAKGGLHSSCRCQLEPRGRAPGHTRDRVRFSGRHHHITSYGAQPRRLRARSPEGGAMDRWPEGVPRI